MLHKKNFLIIVCLILLIFSFGKVNAATLYLVPENKTVKIGEEFNMDVRVDTDGVGINATQAEIKFPVGILEVVEIDKKGSLFNFWAEEPTVSEQFGTINFIGGSAKGVSGTSLQILKIKFKAVVSGLAEITISDVVIAASDGRGTNVLRSVLGARIGVGDVASVLPVSSSEDLLPTGSVEVIKAEQPEKIERVPVVSKKLPSSPELRVPLYPDESRWYNHLGEPVVFWELPPDVNQISTLLSRSEDEKLGIKEEGLFTGKNLGFLSEEGVWYAQVQFKNNVGWGDVSHYKISIDATTPLLFEIEMDTLISDNPAPEIRFETLDSLSGISHALVYVDNDKPIKSTSTSIVLPLQKPGKHKVLVRFFDFAGNSIEDDLEFEVLPLPTPIVNFIPKSVPQDEVLRVLGRSIPSGFVDIKILDDGGMEVYSTFVETDVVGGWDVSIAELLPIGSYSLVVSARDYRDAISYPTDPNTFKIKPRVILSFGFVDLVWFEIFSFVVLVFVIVIGTSFWYYITERRKREVYQIIATRDVDKISNLLLEDLGKMKGILMQIPDSVSSKIKVDLTFYHDKMKDNIDKMKKYVGRELKKIK